MFQKIDKIAQDILGFSLKKVSVEGDSYDDHNIIGCDRMDITLALTRAYNEGYVEGYQKAVEIEDRIANV